MNKIKNLKEQEAGIKAELTALSNIEGRALNTEESTKSQELLSQLSNVKHSIELEERMMAIASEEVVAEVVPAVEISKMDAFEGYLRNGIHNVKSEVRANLVTTSDANGGYIVPDEFKSELYQALKHYSNVMDVATVISTSHGRTIDMPKIDETTVVAAWGAESASLSATDMTYGTANIGANMLRTMVLLSIELIQDNDVNLTGQIANLFAARFGRALEESFTNGDGTSNTPTGFMHNITTGKTAAGATAFTREELVDLIHSVDKAYRANPSFRMVMNDATLAEIRKMAFGTGDDRPLYTQGNATVGEPTRVEGVPVVINSAMPNVGTGLKPIAVGDFSKFIIRQAGSYSFRRLDERFADNLQVAFLGYSRFDSMVIDDNAFRVLEMA
jgi:HK97 family phage major capsid protein